jgi:hypothetical protein
MRKLLWQDQSRQGIDFIDPRIAQLRWLAIKRRFIQRLPMYSDQKYKKHEALVQQNQ